MWRNLRRRHPVRESRLRTDQGTYRGIAVFVSLLIGLGAAWPDLTGGARFDRILIVWMVVAGVVFMVFTRLDKAVLWSAAISGLIAIGLFAAQIDVWLETNLWPGWQIADVATFTGFDGSGISAPVAWIFQQSAMGGFTVLALVLLGLGLGIVRLARRAADHPPE